MSYTTPPANDPPQIAVGLLELEHLARTNPDRFGPLYKAYGESFSWNKTDIAGGVGVAVTASRIVINGDVRAIGGWALAETTNAATASLRLHDGNNANGEVLVRINLAINESTRDIMPIHGIRVFTGRVFVEILSGSVEGVIYWR